jgi:hypothetical protein
MGMAQPMAEPLSLRLALLNSRPVPLLGDHRPQGAVVMPDRLIRAVFDSVATASGITVTPKPEKEQLQRLCVASWHDLRLWRQPLPRWFELRLGGACPSVQVSPLLLSDWSPGRRPEPTACRRGRRS